MALSNIGEQSSELLRAQSHVWSHMFNFKMSMSLKCAIQLDIPDIILQHSKPMTLAELVDNLPINKAKAHGVYRLMRILIHSGFFTEERVSENEEKKGYWLTLASRLLLKEEPFSLVPYLLTELEPKLIEPWHHIAEWLKDDHPTTFNTVHGRSFWDYASHDPKLNHLFNKSMANDSQLITSVVIRDCKHVFESLNSMVDLAGGTGTMAKAIAEMFPNLKCTVLDLPHVVAGLKGTKNLCYIGGDMFESIPPADAILLKWILHNWSDEECVKILKKCKEAIPSKEKGGKLIIIDMIVSDNIQKLEDKEIIESQLLFDITMMVVVGGIERDEREWMKLLKASGFSHYKIINKLGSRSLIEVYPS